MLWIVSSSKSNIICRPTALHLSIDSSNLSIGYTNLSINSNHVVDWLLNMLSQVCWKLSLHHHLLTALIHLSIGVQIFELTCRLVEWSCQPVHRIQHVTANSSTLPKWFFHYQWLYSSKISWSSINKYQRDEIR